MIGGYLGRRPILACLWHAIPRGGPGACPPLPGNFEMQTLGDAFSLILGAKSRALVTDFYQVTANNKVMTNWSVDCF